MIHASEAMDPSDKVTFCCALKEKYCPSMLEYDINIMQISPKREGIIMAQQNHKKKVHLILDGCKINNAGEDGEILETCPLIKELDLSHNFLQDWMQICKIVDQLKCLSFLNLSHNPLQDISMSDSLVENCMTYPCLEKLILNNTNVQFTTLWKLLRLFPCVQELHISLNQYGMVPKETNAIFAALTFLYFAKNEILYWEDIEHLGLLFPSLQTLIICENPLHEIPIDSNPNEFFPLLEKLSITKTMISDWSSLDQLRRFPKLLDIRFSQIPLLDDYENESLRRQLLISRLPNMKMMNGGLIEEFEREDADRAFIRYYKRMEEKPSRYFELVDVYGELNDLVDVCLKKKSRISVTLDGDIENSCLLEVELKQKTIDFRKHIAQLYGLKLSQFRVFYHSAQLTRFGGELMKYNAKELRSYNMREGDRIELQRLDVDDS